MTDLREKLSAIRDSDHPARWWARNVVQCLDELKDRPDDPDLLRALGQSVAKLERTMGDDFRTIDRSWWLTPDDIAEVFGLRHPRDHQ